MDTQAVAKIKTPKEKIGIKTKFFKGKGKNISSYCGVRIRNKWYSANIAHHFCDRIIDLEKDVT